MAIWRRHPSHRRQLDESAHWEELDRHVRPASPSCGPRDDPCFRIHFPTSWFPRVLLAARTVQAYRETKGSRTTGTAFCLHILYRAHKNRRMAFHGGWKGRCPNKRVFPSPGPLSRAPFSLPGAPRAATLERFPSEAAGASSPARLKPGDENWDSTFYHPVSNLLG